VKTHRAGRALSEAELDGVRGGAGAGPSEDAALVACVASARSVRDLFTFTGDGANLRAAMPKHEPDRRRVEAANQVCAKSRTVNLWARALRQAGGPSRPLASLVLMGADS